MNANKNKQKGNRKGLPKLKTILANPNKEKCPSLEQESLQRLGNLLKEVISNSGLKPLPFVTSNHINLGLESSLRAINNSKCSCVLLSRSIQPRVLVRLIARNVEAKNATVPVFVQNELEDFTKAVFGIKALSLVFPTVDEMRANNMDETLLKWIMAHIKLKPTTKILKKKQKITKFKKTEIEVCKESPEIEIQKLEIENTTKGNDEFISFTEGMEVDKADTAEDEKHLVAVLKNVVERVENQAITEAVEVVEMKPNIETQQDDLKRPETFSDSDDFLPAVYLPLTVHKIQPNPNRKPKKKKQKKNKQNKI